MNKKTLKAMAVAVVKGEQASRKAQRFIAAAQQRLQEITPPAKPEAPNAKAVLADMQKLRAGAKSKAASPRAGLLDPRPLYCYRCRQELARGKSFCSRCGAKIKGEHRIGRQFSAQG